MRPSKVSESGQRLLARLLDYHPEWTNYFVEPADSSAELRVPSEHPMIADPLRIVLDGYLPLYWHEGYFFDFLGSEEGNPDQVGDAFEFIRRFVAEEVLCRVAWRDGHKSGGPAELDEVYIGEYDLIQLRSWRGTKDLDIVAVDPL